MKALNMIKLFKLVIVLATMAILTSCEALEAVTIANGTVYTNFDAYVAYDVYYELYDNGLYEHRPIILKNNNKYE